MKEALAIWKNETERGPVVSLSVERALAGPRMIHSARWEQVPRTGYQRPPSGWQRTKPKVWPLKAARTHRLQIVDQRFYLANAIVCRLCCGDLTDSSAQTKRRDLGRPDRAVRRSRVLFGVRRRGGDFSKGKAGLPTSQCLFEPLRGFSKDSSPNSR
jgi:hypothetical protein